MASDEDNHTFSKSPVGTLIARVSKMLRNPVIDTDLNETLDIFLDQLNESQHYLSHGIFNVKFAEAGLFLQNAVTLYGKKVDSLWDSTLQYQMQLCSYTKPSEGNIEEATIITHRLNRNKRKKLPLQEPDNNSSLYEDLNAVCDKANGFLNGRCASMQHHAEANQNNPLLNDHSSDSALSVPVSNDENKSICGFRFPVDCPISNIQTGEKLCSYSDLYLNCAVPFLETSKQNAENVDISECSMTTRKNDWLLQKYVTERHLTYKKFWGGVLGDDFEIYRQAHQREAFNVETNIRASLDERARSLCPKEFVVNVPRLPDELMAEYVKSNNVHVQELIQGLLTREQHIETTDPVANAIKKGSERISDADSLFHDVPFDDAEDTVTLPETCDNILLTQQSSADSGICLSEGLASSVVTESCADTMISEDLPNTNSNDADIEGPLQVVEQHNIRGELGADSFVDTISEEIVENIGRNEFVVDSLDRLENEDENIITGIKNLAHEKIAAVPKQITVVHKSDLKPLKDAKNERKNLKRKLVQEQNSGNKMEKRRKCQTRFRWYKTTTATLTTFETFFKQNYQPEFGEGDIVEDDSDDDEIDAVLSSEEVENEEIITVTDLDIIPSTTVQASIPAVLGDPACRSMQHHDSTASTIDLNDFSSGCENSENIPSNSETTEAVCLETNTSIAQEVVDPIANTGAVNISDDPVSRRENLETESIERLRAVTEWRKFIEPKLKAAEQSCKFDIHEYGSCIMDAIPTGRNLNFTDLVNGKPPSEVTRFFLSSLQLANTYNVELVSSEQGVLANNKLEIKLLSRERYHEHLDEYEAPSENSFREKLARIQALQPSLPLHSTPLKSRSGKCKRQKFC